MMLRTGYQIKFSGDDYVNRRFIDVESLKKEIEDRLNWIKSEYPLKKKTNEDYIEYLKGCERELNYVLDLCNSSEQKPKTSLSNQEITSSEGVSPSVSVSGEHNTGGDDGSVISQRSSSPVQNPQKKCICKKPMDNMQDFRCVICGGAL